ncbi:hypothetical protein C8J56DRAFT_761328, partial [Mycena floridula]
LQGYKSLLAPIRRMPPEVLGHIFTFFCDKNHVSPTSGSVILGLALAGVCSHWRYVALSTHEIWSTIIAEGIGEPNWKQVEQAGAGLEFLLEHSGAHPLTIELNCATEFEKSTMIQAISILGNHSGRWQSLTLAWGPQIVSHLVPELNQFRNKVPLLQSVTL